LNEEIIQPAGGKKRQKGNRIALECQLL